MITLNANPRTLPEARTEIENGQKEIARLEGELQTATDATGKVDVVKLQADLQAMTTRAETAEGVVEARDKTIGELETTIREQKQTIEGHEKTLGENKTKLESFDKDVQNKAIELLAAKGLSPMKLGIDTQGERRAKPEVQGTSRVAAAFKEDPAVQAASK
jgi:predicted RNase H-like nuclease (RuvC/YqgF family)